MFVFIWHMQYNKDKLRFKKHTFTFFVFIYY